MISRRNARRTGISIIRLQIRQPVEGNRRNRCQHARDLGMHGMEISDEVPQIRDVRLSRHCNGISASWFTHNPRRKSILSSSSTNNLLRLPARHQSAPTASKRVLLRFCNVFHGFVNALFTEYLPSSWPNSGTGGLD